MESVTTVRPSALRESADSLQVRIEGFSFLNCTWIGGIFGFMLAVLLMLCGVLTYPAAKRASRLFLDGYISKPRQRRHVEESFVEESERGESAEAKERERRSLDISKERIPPSQSSAGSFALSSEGIFSSEQDKKANQHSQKKRKNSRHRHRKRHKHHNNRSEAGNSPDAKQKSEAKVRHSRSPSRIYAEFSEFVRKTAGAIEVEPSEQKSKDTQPRRDVSVGTTDSDFPMEQLPISEKNPSAVLNTRERKDPSPETLPQHWTRDETTAQRRDNYALGNGWKNANQAEPPSNSFAEDRVPSPRYSSAYSSYLQISDGPPRRFSYANSIHSSDLEMPSLPEIDRALSEGSILNDLSWYQGRAKEERITLEEERVNDQSPTDKFNVKQFSVTVKRFPRCSSPLDNESTSYSATTADFLSSWTTKATSTSGTL